MIYYREAPPPEVLFQKMDGVLTGIFSLMEEPLDVELHNQLVDLAVVLDAEINEVGNQIVQAKIKPCPWCEGIDDYCSRCGM